jgi:rhodanese-related sulfurtransferase
MDATEDLPEIAVEDLARRLAAGEDVLLIDVRERWEREICAIDPSALLPLSEFGGPATRALRPRRGALVVCYCHRGVRSLVAAGFLRGEGIAPGALSLRGGIDDWSRRIDGSVPRY